MVFFTCTHCGEALKKPRVEKHFQFQCRNSISVSCMDCFKDFRGQEYVAHTKCITEAERYGGKDFVARPSKNKGERKQQDWIAVVQSVIETSANLSGAERNILNILSNHENVPRKKAKFFNFMNNVMSGKANVMLVESVWAKIEEAFKKASENKNAGENSNLQLTASKEHIKPVSESDILENENNENLSKEYALSDVKESCKYNNVEGCERISEWTNETTKRKSKKSKKRKIIEDPEPNDESSSNCNKIAVEQSENKSACLVEIQQNGVKKKTSKKRKLHNEADGLNGAAANESQNNCDKIINMDEPTINKFDWNDAILNIVKAKEEVSLKKLKKKVLAGYQTFGGKTTSDEKAVIKFDKMIKKIPQIVIMDGKVKLAT